MPYIAPAVILSVSAAIMDIFWMGRLSLIITYGIVIPVLVTIFYLSVKWSIRSKRVMEGSWLKTAGLIVFFIVLFNAPGTLYFHEIAPEFQYDRFLHFACGTVLVPLILIWVLLSFKIRGREVEKKQALWIAFGLVFLGLFAWEGFQFMIDQIFGTMSFFDYAQSIVMDFWEDVIFGLAGAILGLWYSVRSYNKISQGITG